MRREVRVRRSGEREPGPAWVVVALVVVAAASLGLLSHVSSSGTSGVGGVAPPSLLVGAKSPSITVQASPTAGPAPLTAAFWANVTGATGTPPSISWTFGDGTTGSGAFPSHTYATGGWFNATATATGGGLSSPLTGTVTLHATGSGGGPPLQVTLSPVPSQGASPLPVALTVTASGGTPPYSGSVCFGDGSCVALPPNWNGGALTLNHTYNSTGAFTIVASANDALGGSTASTASLLVTGPHLVAYGIESPDGGNAPLAVSFEAQASGGNAPYVASWDFGDGSVGTGGVGVPASHVYSAGGTFIPRLTITDAQGHQATYTLPSLVVAPSTPPPSGGQSFWTSGWFGAHASAIGAVGLVLVVFLFAFLAERRRKQDLTRQARLLVEAMEKDQEAP